MIGLNRLAGLGLVLALALMAGGCVSNEELDQARLDRDDFRGELQRLHLTNDDLKREIAASYASCDQIDNQLTVMAALNIHEQYTNKLSRPALPEPIVETRPRPEPRPAPEVRPRPRPAPVTEARPAPEKKAAPPPSLPPDLGSMDFGGFGG